MARIYRDRYGIPHIRATSFTDAAHGHGRVTATDRAWQVEWLRRRATGTTAEAVGAGGLPWDRFARRTFLVDTAQRAFAALDGETRAFVTSYADGINAGLHSDAPELTELGIEALPWEQWTPLAVFHAQHLLFSNLGDRLWQRRLESVLGDDAVLFAAEGPETSGSNAWAVGGDRTTSGLPMIGGDPHRTIESPGVYQQVRIACEDPADTWDVAGFAFVGVPGVPHFAHAGEVAWAITNAKADQQDLCVEESPPADVLEQRVETIVVRDAGAEQIEVVRTLRGVLIADGLSLRDAATQLGELGSQALLPLLRARSVDDVDQAFEHWVEPVNNTVIADRSGAVRYRIAGRVPTRDGTPGNSWTGWLDPAPRHDVPRDGQVVTANERRGPESDAVGSDFASPHRADRIHALLDGRSDLTADDFSMIHNDTHLATVAMLEALVPGEFDGWDARMDADSVMAARFAAWRSALVRRIAAEPVFAPLLEPAEDPLFAAWFNLTARVGAGLQTLAAADTPFGIDLADLAREALAEVDAGDPRRWGDTHVFAPVHAFDVLGRPAPEVPAVPLAGDSDCVRCTASYPALSDACTRGSIARYVWDLAPGVDGAARGGWVVPMGASGDPRDEHHLDQLATWAAGDLVPIETDWAKLTRSE